MRASRLDPRILLAALAATFVTLIAAAAAPPQLDDLDLFSGGTPATEAPTTQPAGTPAWVEDPMSLPLSSSRQP